MSLLAEVKAIIETCKIPVETGVFSDAPPDTYAVLTPLADAFDLYADNKPSVDVQEDITITNRRYIGHEDDTGYHHYAIDVAKSYVWED